MNATSREGKRHSNSQAAYLAKECETNGALHPETNDIPEPHRRRTTSHIIRPGRPGALSPYRDLQRVFRCPASANHLRHPEAGCDPPSLASNLPTSAATSSRNRYEISSTQRACPAKPGRACDGPRGSAGGAGEASGGDAPEPEGRPFAPNLGNRMPSSSDVDLFLCSCRSLALL